MNFLKKVGALVVAFVFVATPAFADVWGGGGDFGGGASKYGGWKYTSGSNFATLKNRDGSYVKRGFWESNFDTRGMGSAEFERRCLKSDRVWYTYTNRWEWSWAAHSAYDTRPSFYSQMSSAAPQYVHDWVRNNGKRNLTIVCSDMIEKDYSWEYTESKSEQKDFSQRVPIHENIDVERQITVAGKDPIGKDNLHNQPTVSNRTPFYDVRLKIAKGELKGADEVEKAYNAAKSAHDGTEYTAELDQANKEGMAEGGVLNFTKRTTYADLKATTTKGYVRTVKCTAKKAGGNIVPGTKSCSYGDWRLSSSDKTSNATAETMPEVTGFWQMLSVHCNKDGFNNLVSELGSNAENVKADGTGGDFFASLTTAKSDSERVLVGGNRQDSGSVGFYDKECPFDCTPDYGSELASKNGAKGNVPVKGGDGEPGGAYGNKNTSENTNKFEIFRDNKSVPLDINLWYPIRGEYVLYDGEGAISTTVSRWDKGTPGVVGKSGGKFFLSDKNEKGTSIFGADDRQPPTQRNWDITPFSSSTTAILPGQVTSFWTSATWASDKDLPNKLNFKWEFDPNIRTDFFSKGGFTGAGGKIADNPVSEAARIQGKCYASFGTEKSLPTSDLFQENTGTGTTNDLDGQMVGEGDSNTVDIKTIRSTTE